MWAMMLKFLMCAASMCALNRYIVKSLNQIADVTILDSRCNASTERSRIIGKRLKKRKFDRARRKKEMDSISLALTTSQEKNAKGSPRQEPLEPSGCRNYRLR